MAACKHRSNSSQIRIAIYYGFILIAHRRCSYSLDKYEVKSQNMINCPDISTGTVSLPPSYKVQPLEPHRRSSYHRPLTSLRSSHGFAPCCPARSCVVQVCWRKTWRGCTAGPPASLDLARAPSFELWPSELCGYVWLGPSHLMGKLCSVTKDRNIRTVGYLTNR